MTSYIFNLSAVFFKNFFINFYYYIWKVFPCFTIVNKGTMALTSQYLKSTNLSTVFSPCLFNLILSGSLYFMQTNATLHPLRLYPWKIISFHFKPRLLSSRNLVEHIIKKIDKSAEKFRSCKLNTKTVLTDEYIAGLVQADGSFSAVLCRRTKQNNHRYQIDLKFTLKLGRSEPNKNLILEIKNKLHNKGNFIFYKNTIKYQITNQNDLLNVVIPFFMKHHLRGDKLLSFLRFKYISAVIFTKSHLNDKNIFLSLIVIAGQLNYQDKLGKKIRYLKPKEQRYVVNNIIPEGVDIGDLTDDISNFKPEPLALDFVKGLFETNTNNYRKLSKEDQDYIRDNFLPKGLKLWKFKEYYLTKGVYPKYTKEFYSEIYLSSQRSYSTNMKAGGKMSPVKIYKNADKRSIISENKGKSGIYRWTNLTNGKSYIGSSVNLSRRFREYYSILFLEK